MHRLKKISHYLIDEKKFTFKGFLYPEGENSEEAESANTIPNNVPGLQKQPAQPLEMAERQDDVIFQDNLQLPPEMNQYVRRSELRSEAFITPQQNVLRDLIKDLSSPYTGKYSSIHDVRKRLNFREY